MVAALEEVPLGAARIEGLRKDVQCLAAYFYADNRLLVLTLTTRLQRAFDTLTELFECVGLRTNVAKTVSTAYHPCHALEYQSL